MLHCRTASNYFDDESAVLSVADFYFSNHTGYEHFFYTDYTDNMDAYMQEWKRLDLQFKGICTGFLGSAKQIQIVSDFIRQFKENDSIVIIDPVMGDYGKPYPTYTDEMCKK